MRSRSKVWLAVLVCCGLGLSGRGYRAAAAAGFKGDTGEEAIWRLPLEQKLEQTLSFRFEAMPLADAVDYLRQALEINIVLDPNVQYEVDRSITFSARNMRAADALRWVVTLARLEYGFHHGAIYISTPRSVRAAETAFFRAYDVRDFTMAAARGARNFRDDDSGRRGSQWLVRLIVEMTGRENWRHVAVVGGGADTDEFTMGADHF